MWYALGWFLTPLYSKAAGMEKTLHLPDYGYNLAAAFFYIFYAAFEVGPLCFIPGLVGDLNKRHEVKML